MVKNQTYRQQTNHTIFSANPPHPLALAPHPPSAQARVAGYYATLGSDPA